MTAKVESSSFKDPLGRTLIIENNVYRLLTHEGYNRFKEIVSDKILDILKHKIIETDVLLEKEKGNIFDNFFSNHSIREFEEVLVHPKISFPNYPYEWSSRMLFTAGIETLEISRELLKLGWGLKDASPYNMMFNGTHAVFLDVLSFEKRKSDDCIWIPFYQFQKSFLFPLMLDSKFGFPVNKTYLSFFNGIELNEIYPFFRSLASCFNPYVLLFILIPGFLGNFRQATHIPKKYTGSCFHALNILDSTFLLLENAMKKFGLSKKTSIWAKYQDDSPSYTSTALEIKSKAIELFFKEKRPKNVLDIGCNTGRFSLSAADFVEHVVAIDSDAAAIDSLFVRARKQRKANVLPLVMDFANPTPKMGWRNLETLSFVERCSDYFDCVMALALVHHLVVSQRLPLHELFAVLHDITRKYLIIEFVGFEDPQFQSLLRGRDSLFSHWNRAFFEHNAQGLFQITNVIDISYDRKLYFCEKI